MDERSSARPELARAGAPRPTPPRKPVRPNAPPAPRRAANALEPTILLVGADSAFVLALRSALARHRVYVETTLAETVADTVVAAAPDLVLLAGAAAEDGGSAVLRTLLRSPVSSVVPVAILDDNTALDMRLRAFRHGAAAVIAATASMDAIAEQVAKLAREIPERAAESLGVLGEAALSEFAHALSREHRSGILSVHSSADGDDKAARLVLGSGQPLAALVDEFVEQVKAHAVHAEPLHYEFAEHAGGTVALLDRHTPAGTERVSVQGVRVVLADDDAGRADTVAAELRARGVSVVVTDLAPTAARFRTLRQVDPELLLIGEAQLKGQGYELLRRMRRDTRLRWAALLVVRWDELWGDALSVPGLERLETAIAALSEADRSLQAWAETGDDFAARLETTGPARCLRALSASPRLLRITVNNPRVTVNIDLANGLVVGASAESRLGAVQRWDGAVALSAYMALSSGRLHISPVHQPALTNVMATVDVALNMADSEPSPIAPSIAATVPASLRPPAAELPVARPQRRLLARVTHAAQSLGRTGVSLPITVFLVALAALQGLQIVGVLSFMLKPRGAVVHAPRAPSSASLSSALAASRPLKAAPAAGQPVAAVVGGAAPAPARVQTQPTSPGAPTAARIPLDEAGVRAPSCEQLAFAPTNEGEHPDAAYDQMREAHRALVRGDVNATERALCKAALWDQKNPAIPLEVAQLMLLRRDGASAVDWAQKSIRLAPTALRAQGILGDGLARLGDYEGAKRAWLKSLKLEQASEPQVKSLSFGSLREAQAALTHKDFARAERFFRRAVVLDGDNAQAASGLANALLKLGDVSSALHWASYAVSIAPSDPAARVLLGDTLFQKGDQSGAEAQWREALRIDPRSFVAALRINKLKNTR